ncbi:asparagine synthase-related protein [Metabacillus halosaccharovorans]|uniref:asparagine synthase (glutamine-hydrolyzing) n=1 Tax=Metabacillus halosaccharovorans TaxID=930124 RepID=A0ABT3DM54_9BACI|nr:asparagine synthase-related protein [Metabacillus halosaccharovorans]MCV9888145.1 asparagine synthase-related protein [Metabacillus halosaccharovorans]
MSAIAGIVHLNDEPINVEQGNNVMSALQKYPADDIQVWHNERIFFGCHAQWITPESVGEQIPYYDYERQLLITADAIIDNRKELFQKLQISTSASAITDSQLILLAYEKWGEDVPKYLVGDFAFLIWDERNQHLFGARDFSGTRTLYFFHNKEKFACCTVIEPLFLLPYIQKNLNEQWLAEFIAIPVTADSVSINTTVYKDIQQIPPSHTIKVQDGKVELSRYSMINSGEKLKLKSSNEYEEAFKEVFDRAVGDRLRTYKQVGSHLSGGLDSGSVVSFASKTLKEKNKKLHTYSYVPVDDFIDWTHRTRIANERPFIESTVQYVGNISDQYLSFPEKNPFSEIDDWLDTMEMPYKFYENSFWLKGIYEQANQQDVGILLNGQRGNWTVSWGHALHFYGTLLKKLKFIKLYKEVKLYSKNLGVNKKRTMKFVLKKALPLLNRPFSSPNQDIFPIWINQDFAARTNVFQKLEEQGVDIKGNTVTDVYKIREKQFEQLHFWGLNGTIGTKLSLRHSLWERDPTNDLRVINFCISVPEDQYVQNGLDRSLIRRSTENLLPDNIRLNQRTRGIQGADGIHRMKKSWQSFIEELNMLSNDSIMSNFINIDVFRDSLEKVKYNPKPEFIYEFEFKILMRSLILYRFLKPFEGR